MALLAESLVEERLNREGCIIIRGFKHGLGEMDLLAVRRQPDGVGWHVEVQSSFRPIEVAGASRRESACGSAFYIWPGSGPNISN